jgi:hypothetical protein
MKDFLAGLASAFRAKEAKPPTPEPAGAAPTAITSPARPAPIGDELPANARLVVPDRDDVVLQIVGEQSYQAELQAVGGAPGIAGVPAIEHIATLVREPGNPYDRNAISVRIRGLVVGYLTRDDATRFQAVTDWLADKGQVIACQARLIGGWDRGMDDRGSIGCMLHIGSPGETLLTLVADEITIRTDHTWAGWMVAFTGDSRCAIAGVALDRASSIVLARRAGMFVHPRLTKKVQLLIDCDPTGESGNQLKAIEYGVPVVSEREFWAALDVPVDAVVAWGRQPEWQRGGRDTS